MSHACTPILVGVASLVSEILLLSKTAKFPFPTMDYSPWGVTSQISEILLLSKMAKFPFSTMDYSPWSSKNLIVRIGSKILASRD